MSYTTCPHCDTAIKNSSFFSGNSIVDADKIEFVRNFSEDPAEAYCDKCYPKANIKATENWNQKHSELTKAFDELLPSIPIISLQVPLNWDYEVLELVTAQSVTGTGVIAEFTSNFTDLFGLQSGRYNSKLKAGEDLCKSQLRVKAMEIGANAIIGTDIDYAEVGGDKGMLMVCMSGTAIRLKNVEMIPEKQRMNLYKLIELPQKLQTLAKYEKYAKAL